MQLKWRFFWVGLLLILLTERSALAYITVHPGIYELPVLLVEREGKIEAHFNLRTRSPLSILLKGKKAEAYIKKVTHFETVQIKIKVTQKINTSEGEAELLDVTPVLKGHVAIRVGDDLRSKDE